MIYLGFILSAVALILLAVLGKRRCDREETRRQTRVDTEGFTVSRDAE
jgi:hypothetical protein